MPQYGYLDQNIWQGAGNAAQGMGDALSRAIVGTQALRFQQAQREQEMMMDQQRLALERAKLLQNAPLIRAQTAYNQAGANLDLGKLGELRTAGQAGGTLGDVMKGIGETDVAKNPETMKMLQAIAAQQQSVLASQNPQNIARQTADIQMGMTPEGRKFVSAGYPPTARPGLPPEQQALLSLLKPIVQAQVAPETETDLLGRRSTTRDVQGGLDLADIIARGMYPGSTNIPPRIQMETPQAAPAPAAPAAPATLPKVGEVRKGYRFKGGDPSQQGSWEAVK